MQHYSDTTCQLKVHSHQTRMTRINRAIHAKLDAWTFWVYSLHSHHWRVKFTTQQTLIRVMGGASAMQLQSPCKMYSCFCKSTKMYIQLRVPTYNHNYFVLHCCCFFFVDFLPPLVMTSLLEQAPDWLTRREYPPKFRFFEWRESREKNAQFAPFAPPHSRE